MSTALTRLPLLLVLFALACAEETTSPPPAQLSSVTWLEWPTAVTRGVPGRIRIIGPGPDCGRLVLNVTARYPYLTVQSASIPFDGPCPLGFPVFSYDTTLALPVLDASQGVPAYYAVVATSLDRTFGDLLTRTFGFLRLDGVPDTTVVAAGLAMLVADSAGCAWARVEAQPALAGRLRYVVVNPPDLGGAPERPAFIGGRLVPATPPQCGESVMLELSFAEVIALP